MERKASDQLSHPPVRLGEPSPQHPPTQPDGSFSLGSAAVGAALSNPPTPGSGVREGLGNEPVGKLSLGKLRKQYRGLGAAGANRYSPVLRAHAGRSIHCTITAYPARASSTQPWSVAIVEGFGHRRSGVQHLLLGNHTKGFDTTGPTLPDGSGLSTENAIGVRRPSRLLLRR